MILSVIEFIVLATGFGVGYWLITTACREENWKKILGAVFGWILIIYAVIIAGMICFQWINYLQTGKLPFQCPMMQQRQQMQPGQMRDGMRQQGMQEKMQQKRMLHHPSYEEEKQN